MEVPLPGRPLLLSCLLLAIGLGACSDYEVVKLEAEDVFYQLEAGEVDVLLVVDNSCSMEPYQDKLADNFDTFLTFFIEGDVDYHIGVITTTVADSTASARCPQATIDEIPGGGHLVDDVYITPETDGGDQLFSDLVKVGTCGSGFEMGLESAWRAVTPPLSQEDNFTFLRDTAYLSVIFVSDEQDSSPAPVNDYINAFRDVKKSEDLGYNASALVVNDIDTCNAEQVDSGADEGTRYLDVANQSDGVVANICADDFEDIVTELSLTSSQLTDTFYLSDLPAPESIILAVDGEEVDCADGEWSYQLLGTDKEPMPAVVFDRVHLPPPQSKVTVLYDRGAGDPADFCPDAGGDSTGGN